MPQIVIGKAGHHNVSFDLKELLATRLLIQANSGGGKSYLLRRLMEQAFDKVQIICIDPEGEFATLREKFGFVLVGEGGETPADVRSAGMLAERLLELRASAVCDLYEAFRSHPIQRREWVRRFLTALIDAPRKLWHPLLVIVDEAHKFCPQETPKAASMIEREIISGCKEAMIAVATTGRKRGFCAVWATQRLAKADKDATAELFNRLVGMTIEDVDVERAADLMSVAKADRHEFKTKLRTLSPGEFFAFGRAIAKERVLIKVGDIETTHPKLGDAAKQAGPPPAPDEVKKLLPNLADLPQEVEHKEKTEREMKAEIGQLKAELRKAKQQQPVAQSVAKEVKVADPRAIAMAVKKRDSEWAEKISNYQRRVKHALALVDVKFTAPAASTMPAAPPLPQRAPEPVVSRPVATPRAPKSELNGGGNLPAGEKAILIAIAQYPDGAERDQLTVLTGYKRSTRDAYILRLNQRSYVEQRGERVFATEPGIAALGSDYEPLPSGQDLQDYWLHRLPTGERDILKVLLGKYPEAIAREILEEHTGFKRSTRDAYIQRLNSRRLVEVTNRGEVRASENLF